MLIIFIWRQFYPWMEIDEMVNRGIDMQSVAMLIDKNKKIND
jgi:hypothetical protein